MGSSIHIFIVRWNIAKIGRVQQPGVGISESISKSEVFIMKTNDSIIECNYLFVIQLNLELFHCRFVCQWNNIE